MMEKIKKLRKSMKLRELFEARQQSVGIIFGRFNPPHMGHMKAWEMASENNAWFVGTNQSTQGPKDPLPYDIKVKAMLAIMPEIKGHIVPETSWLTLASKVYKKYGDVALNVYTDEDWVTKALVQYNGKEGAHGFYNFSNIQQQATPRLSSATALRAAVQADDRDAFGQAAGVDPNTPVAGRPFFDVVKHYLMPHAEKAAAKVVKKKVKEPVAENNSISTMPTTEYVKGIYAAAAENGMGAPAVDAVKKQMVLAPNGEVDIIATMQKALQVFQSPAWKKMIADLTALVKKAEAQQGMSGINELSNELLGRYKKAAGADAKKADAEGDYARGNKRFSGIVKATKKQFANDEKGVAEDAGKEFAYQGYKIKFTPTQLVILKGGDVALTRPGDFSNPSKQQMIVARKYIDQMWQKEKEHQQFPNISHQHDLYGITKEYDAIKKEIQDFLKSFEKERAELRTATRSDNDAWYTGINALNKKYHNSPELTALRAKQENILARMKAIKKGSSWSKEGVAEGIFDSKPKVDFKARAKELFAKGLTEQQVLQQLIKEGCPPRQAAVVVQGAQLEDAAGVGIITKQNTTVDVNKGTPRKNLKAFRLI